MPTFPAGDQLRPFWGAGFQLGLLYNLNDNWNLGFSYKSPIWQERYGFNSCYPDLAARRIGIQAQVPEIFSWGIAYKGFERALIDVDLRYFDYENTSLYGTKPIDGGLGWSSIFAVAVGGQYQATEKLTLRAGYLYNTNPIKATDTLFNVQAPGFLQHMLALGVSYKLTDDIILSAGLDPSVPQFDRRPDPPGPDPRREDQARRPDGLDRRGSERPVRSPAEGRQWLNSPRCAGDRREHDALRPPASRERRSCREDRRSREPSCHAGRR